MNTFDKYQNIEFSSASNDYADSKEEVSQPVVGTVSYDNVGSKTDLSTILSPAENYEQVDEGTYLSIDDPRGDVMVRVEAGPFTQPMHLSGASPTVIAAQVQKNPLLAS